MLGKFGSICCYMVVFSVIANAFMPVKLHQHRKASLQMQNDEARIDAANWGRALAILSLTAGLYSTPVFAVESVATPSTPVSKTVTKGASVPAEQAKGTTAVATPPAAKIVAPVKIPAIPEEKAVVDAYNKKAATKSKIDQLVVNVKQAKSQLTQSRSDMKKSEVIIDGFVKKMSKSNIDKDLKGSLLEDMRAEEKVFNQAKKVLTNAESSIERGTDEISKLENVLKGDEKFIESKKQLLKKREAEIVKEAKAAQEKKVKAAADLRQAAIKKEVKAAEGVVATAQKNLDASIIAKKQSQQQVGVSKDLVKAEKENLKKATENTKNILKALEKGKAAEESENKKIVELTAKIATAELVETKAGELVKSMESVVSEAKAKLSATQRQK